MEPWDNDFSSPSDPFDNTPPSDPYRTEQDIYNSIQSSRIADDLVGESSGRGILGDSAADAQLAHDIASGMSVRDALEYQRLTDYTVGDRHSHGILSDTLPTT